MKTKKRNYTIIITIILAVIIIGIVLRKGSANGRENVLNVPVAVEVAPVQLLSITENVSAVGTISALTDATISSETSGRVTRVAVKVGDIVRSGQVLIYVDDELKAIAVEQAKAQMLAAETNLEKAKKDYERSEKLFDAKNISPLELDSYKLAMQSAEAQDKGAQVQLKLAQRQYDDTKIKSPITGTVASRSVDIGEMVSPGKQVANVVDISKVKIKLSIPEEYIGSIRLNQPATVRIDTDPNVSFKGKVYSVGSKSESPNGHSYPVEVIVENKNNGILKVGMFARVAIEIMTANKTIVLSKESLAGDESNPQVFVAENNKAKLCPIKIGIHSGEKIQILDGLKEGDQVITFGQRNLKDGAAIQYKK